MSGDLTLPSKWGCDNGEVNGKEQYQKEGSAKKKTKKIKMWLDPEMNALVKVY